jgi:hypothetical protein
MTGMTLSMKMMEGQSSSTLHSHPLPSAPLLPMVLVTYSTASRPFTQFTTRKYFPRNFSRNFRLRDESSTQRATGGREDGGGGEGRSSTSSPRVGRWVSSGERGGEGGGRAGEGGAGLQSSSAADGTEDPPSGVGDRSSSWMASKMVKVEPFPATPSDDTERVPPCRSIIDLETTGEREKEVDEGGE